MPFKKQGDDDFVSPSGKHFTRKQVTLYYATEGFRKPVRGAKPAPRSTPKPRKK